MDPSSLDDLNKYSINFNDIQVSEITADSMKSDLQGIVVYNNTLHENVTNKSLKLEKSFINNENTKIDELLEEWRMFCDTNSKMHLLACSYYKFINNIIILSSILLSSISSILSLTIISKDDKCVGNDTVALLAFNSINILSTALITIHRLLKLEETQHLHDIYSDMYTCTAKDIEMHVILCESHSPVFSSKNELMKQIKHNLDILIDKSPNVPGYLQKQIINKVSLDNETKCTVNA